MRVDGIAFTSPAGLEDSTSYSYRAEAGDEELYVEFELPVGGATPAAEVMAEMREGLAEFFGAQYSVVDEGEASLAGARGPCVQYRLSGDLPAAGKILVANVPEAGCDWIKLRWTGVRDDAEVPAIFDPIAASFRAEADASGPVPPGYRREVAGAYVLDVPARLHGPRTFIYEDPVAELRVEVSVLRGGDPEPGLSAGVAGAGAREVSREEQALDDGERVDLRVESEDDPNGESALILAKRELALAGARAGERRWVVLSASAPASEAARLTALVDALLASVRPDDGAWGGVSP